MNKLFNTVFETELRFLILLDSIVSCDVELNHSNLTADKLTAMDFITLYAESFGVSNKNLHGDGDYKFSEFAIRRELAYKALRGLVRRNLATVRNGIAGFTYEITDCGKSFAAELVDEYSSEYRAIAETVIAKTTIMNERELTSFINNHSTNSIRR